MKYVGVLHKEGQNSVYWFSVPESISHLVSVGSTVICDTRRGNQPGKVLFILDGIDEERASAIIGGNYFPLNKLVGVDMDFEVSEIHIPWEIEQTLPNPNKIAQRVKEFYSTNRFNTNVVISPDGNLRDGYTAYLVAKMFGHDTIHGMCRCY